MQFIVTKILYIFEYGNNKVANLVSTINGICCFLADY